MPGITDLQWNAIRKEARKTAFAVIKEEADKVRKDKPVRPKSGDEWLCPLTGARWKFILGAWRRQDLRYNAPVDEFGRISQASWDGLATGRTLHRNWDGDIVRRAPVPKKARVLTRNAPEYPTLRVGNAPVSVPTSEFWLVVCARCYPIGGSPTRDKPWLVSSETKVMHATESLANEEAKRVAALTGLPFVVMHSTTLHEPAKVKKHEECVAAVAIPLAFPL